MNALQRLAGKLFLRRVAALVAGSAAVSASTVVAYTGVTLTASGQADFTVTATPTSQTVQQGQAAAYVVTLQKLNGFSSPVGLAVTALPAGATASFSPQTLDAKTSSTLTITAPPGSYTGITVTASGGGRSHPTNPISLTVQAAPPPPASGFTLSVDPASQSLLPGNVVSYSVTASRVGTYVGSVALSVGGAPSGATVSFTPASIPVGGAPSTLQIFTKNNTTNGAYTLTVTGVSGAIVRTASTSLVVSGTGRPFSLALNPSGDLTQAVVLGGPGTAQPLNLTLSNLNSQPMQVTNVTVTVRSVTKASGVTAACTTADYAVIQMEGGTYPILLAAGQTATLTQLGVPTSRLPALAMLNTDVNQYGCKRATVNLTFTGSGQG